MLSTLSSLIPSALSDRLEKHDLRSDNQGNKMQADTQAQKEIDTTEDSNKKERKKKYSSYETYIVVRPPPAMSNHPLNLQLQLVPAHHSRDRSNTAAATPAPSQTAVDLGQGIESTPAAAQSPSSPTVSEEDHGLKRSPSNRSSRSESSAFYASSTTGSTGSVASFASVNSASSGRRMIIPLYNLSAHNVMTNTILDAGTDARVAKFHKRNLEVIDLAIIEPSEVWRGKERAHGAGVGAASDALGVPLPRSASPNLSLMPRQAGSRAVTPDPSHSPSSSRLSLSSDPSSSAPHTHHPTSDPIITPTAIPVGPKKLFGKIFRKKEASNGGSKRAPSVSDSVTAPSIPPTPEPRPAKQSTDVLLPAVLGLSPLLLAATNPPTGRCVSYVWIVRKWLKAEPHGFISGVIGKIGKEGSAHGIGGLEWEVRFDWVRGNKNKGDKARRLKKRASMDAGSPKDGSLTPSTRMSTVVGSEDAPEVGHLTPVSRSRGDHGVKKSTSRTPSPASVDVLIPSTNKSDDEFAGSHYEDADDDSEPEDSETPWTCQMILTHSSNPPLHPTSMPTKGHFRSRTVASLDAAHDARTLRPPNHNAGASESGHEYLPPAPIKVKVATLSPAPHHPKVVCQLKIPFPLPDVEVEQGTLRKRVVLPDGSTRSTVPGNRGPASPQSLTLTAEEIKDVVCSTAFWVVVREGFGGVGKKNRKGDGWNIRG